MAPEDTEHNSVAVREGDGKTLEVASTQTSARPRTLHPANAPTVVGKNGGLLPVFTRETAREAAIRSARKRRLASMRGAERAVAAECPEINTVWDAVEELTARQTFIAMQVDGKRAPAAFRNVMDAISPDLEARLLREAGGPAVPSTGAVLAMSSDALAAAMRAALEALAAAGVVLPSAPAQAEQVNEYDKR